MLDSRGARFNICQERETLGQNVGFTLSMLDASYYQCEVSPNPREPAGAARVDTSGEAEHCEPRLREHLPHSVREVPVQVGE